MGFPLLPSNKQITTSLNSTKPTRSHAFFPITNLPSHIITEILSLLPLKSIIICKSVCKKWHALITHPYFASLHFSRARPALLVHLAEMFKKYFTIVDLDDSYNRPDHLPTNTMLKFKTGGLSRFQDADIVMDGSVHGLVFLRDINYKHESFYVCNPITREYVTIPSPPQRPVRYPCLVTHGFGIAETSCEYKVVRIFQDRVLDPRTRESIAIPFSECHVYNLQTGAWRRIGHAPFAYDGRSIGMFFHGSIHWLIRDLTGHELISCFDLEREAFRAFPGPFPGRKMLGSLGVLKGSLCLCNNTSESEIDIWVMGEYGERKSWRKDIVIKKPADLVGPCFRVASVVQGFRNGEVLIMWGDYFMFYYCTKSEDVREVDVDQPVGPNSIETMSYVPSFLSLAKFVKEKVCVF